MMLGSALAATGNDELVIGLAAEGDTLDPIRAGYDLEALKVTRQIFDGLVRFSKWGTEVEPALATAWSTSDDGLVWTFTLREGVRFHDGTPFDATAVVYNVKRWQDPNEDGYEVFSDLFGASIQDVEAVDEYTVRFTLSEPHAPFLSNLAMEAFAISSPAAIERYGPEYGRNPSGTGPFALQRWDAGEIVLVANPDHWDGEPLVDRVVFRVIADIEARYSALLSGEIDIMDGVSPEFHHRSINETAVHPVLRPPLNVGYIAMNTEKEPFDDVRVRRAINHAVDKHAITRIIFGELGVAGKNPMPPSIWGWNDEIADYEYDPQKAKSLLAEAGYPGGFAADLAYMPVPRPYFPEPRLLAELVAGYLGDIGIEVTLSTAEWGEYNNRLDSGAFDMGMSGWIGDNGDPDNFLYVLLGGGGERNTARYANGEVEELLLAARKTTDAGVRRALYMEAQKLILADAPWIVVGHAIEPVLVRSNVNGYVPHAVGTESLAEVYKD